MLDALIKEFRADEIELQVPDARGAWSLLSAGHSDLLGFFDGFFDSVEKRCNAGPHDIARAHRATQLAVARVALRHGGLNGKHYAYHNEAHAIEILARIESLFLAHGSEFDARDWLVLALFAACHDLRQNEKTLARHAPFGANELASIAETHRIMKQCGFEGERDKAWFVALDLAIAGSTFNVGSNGAGESMGQAAPQGPLSAWLPLYLGDSGAAWRDDAAMRRGLELALIASDLDTANVADPFPAFARSAAQLASELASRAGRSLDSREAGQSILHFLTVEQERYFFELHQFASAEGRAWFSARKEKNAPLLKALVADLRHRFAREAGFSGSEVLRHQAEFAQKLSKQDQE